MMENRKYKSSYYNHYGLLHSGDYLIYNVFSSAVGIITPEEKGAIESCQGIPELMETCIEQGFIIPAEEREIEKVLALRNATNFSSTKAGFQILPTTACNARCFYCYEQGFPIQTMTPETLEATAKFIINYSEGMQEVNVTWFGGEPFMQEGLIQKFSEQLIPALERKGIQYGASVITNGSFLSDMDVEKIKETYRITNVQITLDGSGDTHITRKGFVAPEIEYQTIMQVIAQLTNHQVETWVRINVDRDNLESCLTVIDDLKGLDADKDYLWPYVAPLYSVKNSSACFNSDELNTVFSQVYRKLIDCSFIKTVNGLPMHFTPAICSASQQNNYVIAPTGDILKCEHLFGVSDEVVGSVYQGLVFNDAYAKWADPFISHKCKSCKELPACQAGCYASEQSGFGYGRCPCTAFVHEAIVSAVDYLLEKEGGESL